MLALSATFTEAALGALHGLMPDAQRIFLAADTISLLGVQQFYVTLPGACSGLHWPDASSHPALHPPSAAHRSALTLQRVLQAAPGFSLDWPPNARLA